MVSSAGGTVNFNLIVSAISGRARGRVQIWGYNSITASWTLRATSGDASAVGVSTSNGVIWAPTDTHFTFQADSNEAAIYSFAFDLAPQGGASITVQPLGDPGSAVVHFPDWSALLAASKRAQIVACDVLVTFEGSNLENGGSIAACNADDDLPIRGSFYNTIASQPFDMYRGRLASVGETEGGAHWHYIPDDLDAFTMVDVTEAVLPVQRPRAYIGIQGKAVGQPVRIECHFIVNFLSHDPSYNMEISPCFSAYPHFLWVMRDLVPLVSSNDSHLKKIRSFARGAGTKLLKAKNFAQTHDKEIAKALGLMATLL